MIGWLKNNWFINRIKDLIIKFVSVKGTAAIVSTIIFYNNPDKEWAFWFCVASWGLLILGREIFKIITALKGGS